MENQTKQQKNLRTLLISGTCTKVQDQVLIHNLSELGFPL